MPTPTPTITVLIRHPLTAPPVTILSSFHVRAELAEALVVIARALRERIARHERN